MKFILAAILFSLLPLFAVASTGASTCSELGGGMLTMQTCYVSDDNEAQASLTHLPATVQICANGDYREIIEVGFDGDLQVERENSVLGVDISQLATDHLRIDLSKLNQGPSFETSISNTAAKAEYHCIQNN